MRIPAANIPSSKFRAPSAEQLLQAVDPALTPRGIKDLVKTKKHDDMIEQELLSLEALKPGKPRRVTNQHKFGVLYCRGAQNEDEIYSNGTGYPLHARMTDSSQVTGSKRYLEFLEFLGETVQLLDWSHYAGGLDTSKRTHQTHLCHMGTNSFSGHADGPESIYTQWREKEIMFHVTTLLPYNRKHQQLDRKKHVGNDTCAIVFNDGPAPFDPSVMLSKYTRESPSLFVPCCSGSPRLQISILW